MTTPSENYPIERVCPSKSCIHAGKIQPISEFSKDKSRKSGHHAQCKTCKYAQADEWRSKNVAKVKANRNEYYRVNAEKYRKAATQWKKDHPERAKENKRLYRERNPERFRAYARAKRARHLEQYRAASKVYHFKTKVDRWGIRHVCECRIRARKKGLPFNMTVQDLLVDGKLPEFCPVIPKIRLDYAAGPDKRIRASIDRIVNHLGYVSGNVRVISLCANLAKLDGIGDLI